MSMGFDEYRAIVGIPDNARDRAIFLAGQTWQAIESRAEWREIETAPKDGSRFLAIKHGEIVFAFYDADSDEFVDSHFNSHLTHWAPLILPPKLV